MTSWKKKNKLRMKIYYTLDKYRESDKYKETIEIIEGEMSYVNMPLASTFMNIETPEGDFVSISRDCILKIEWITMPKWTLLNEKQVVDSAEMRLKNLDNELEIQRNTFDQEERLKNTVDKDVG